MRKKTLITAITLFLAVLVTAGIALATSRDAEATSHTDIAKFNSLNTLVLKTYNDWRTNYDTYRTSSAYDWMDWSEDGCSTPWDVTVPYKVSRCYHATTPTASTSPSTTGQPHSKFGRVWKSEFLRQPVKASVGLRPNRSFQR